MSEKSAKSGLAYAAIATLAVVLTYGASFGPACWAAQRTGADGAIVSFVYQPLLQIGCRGPQPICGCLMQYSRLGMSPGCCEVIRRDDTTGYCRWDHTVIFACVW